MRIGVEIDSSNYTFNALAKTITFTGITGLSLESFSLITNVEQGDNVVIYQFQKLGKGATFSGNTLTLEYNTASMSNSDALKINASVNYNQVTQTVTLTNPTETGLAKDLTLTNLLPDFVGTWNYKAGASGTATLTGSKRVIGIAAYSLLGGSVTINGGDSIPIVANLGFSLEPKGNLIDPTIVFTGTDSYIIEHLS